MATQASAAGASAIQGKHRIAQLAQEVFEGAAVAVAAQHQPPPVVVAVQLVPERQPVPDQHGVVPGDGHHRAGQQRHQHAVPSWARPRRFQFQVNSR